MFDSNGIFIPEVELYNILLIDDEKSVRESIKNSVDWNGLGINMIQEAENGIEGLEQLFQCIPDIIILDIQMPRMDGIEFATLIRKRFPQIRIVILSGYDLFEYAQRAIRIGVNDYILKPFLPEQIPQIIQRQLQALKIDAKSTSQNSSVDHLQIVSNISNAILGGSFVSSEDLKVAFDSYISNYGEMCYYVQFCNHDVIQLREEDVTSTIVMNSVIDNVIKNEGCGFSFQTYNKESVAIIFGDKSTVQRITTAIRIRFSKMMDASLLIAVSSVGNIAALERMRKQAREAQQKCFLVSNPLIVWFDDIKKQNTAFEYPNEIEMRILSMCFFSSVDFISVELDSFFSCIISSDIDSNTCKYALLRLLSKLSSCIDNFNSMNISIDPFYNFDPLDILQSFCSVHEAQTWILDLFKKENAFFLQADNNSKTTFQIITEYINNNYSDDQLNLKKCSSDLYLSYGYISRVLKKTTDQTFVEYLNSYRIQQAKLLLANRRMSIIDIAESVGFTNSSYFSTVFKKYTKLSPQQYRQICTNEKQ